MEYGHLILTPLDLARQLPVPTAQPYGEIIGAS